MSSAKKKKKKKKKKRMCCVHNTLQINSYNQLNLYQMRPNQHLFYVSYPSEFPYGVQGYSDIDVSDLRT